MTQLARYYIVIFVRQNNQAQELSRLPIPYNLRNNRLAFSYVSKRMGWVMDNSCINDTPKTETKIEAIDAIITDSVYCLDI
jgi:hypothetical protein